MIHSKLPPHKHLVKVEELMNKLDELYETNVSKWHSATAEDIRAIKLDWEAHVAVVLEMMARKNML